RVLQQLACRVYGTYRSHRFHAAVCLCSVGYIASSCAYAQNTNPVLVHKAAGRQVRNGAADVLGPLEGVLQASRFTLAFSLTGRVKGQGGKSFFGQFLRISSGSLFLDTASRMAHNDSRQCSSIEIIRDIENSGDFDVVA